MSEIPLAAVAKKKIIVIPKKRKPELVDDWPLSQLQDHPKQNHYFPVPVAAEIEKLAGNLQRNTQTDAVEITAEGVIISGHKRVLAARFLGWETIRVLVRYDLAGDDKAIEHRLIEANEDRRHLSTFQRARLQYQMWRLCPEGNTRAGRGQIKEEVAATLGICVRQVRRYFALFDGPPVLQQAVQDGRLLPSHAFGVLKLSTEQMDPILDLLRNGDAGQGEVRALVKQTVAGDKAPRPTRPAALLKKFLKAGDELVRHQTALKTSLTKGQSKSVAKLRRLLERMEGKSSSAA